MSRYQNTDWDDLLKDSTPEQRLATLLFEMQSHIPIIKGYAQLLEMKLSEENAAERLEEFQDWAEKIVIGVTDLQTLQNEVFKASQKEK